MPLQFTVLYALHVLFGIAWFGGALFSLLVLGPACSAVSEGALAEIGPAIGVQAGKIMPAAAALTILLGIWTAVATGRFASPSAALSDPYGRTVLAALVIAIATYVWAKRVVETRVHVMQTAPPAQKQSAMSRVMQGIAVEQAGFLSILFCMVLMRFGY